MKESFANTLSPKGGSPKGSKSPKEQVKITQFNYGSNINQPRYEKPDEISFRKRVHMTAKKILSIKKPELS